MVVPFETRSAAPSDIEWLYELRRSVYREVVIEQFDSWEEDRQRKMFEDGLNIAATQILIVVGEPVGMVCVEERSDCLSLGEIQVLPSRQGSGLGSVVVQGLIDKARELGVPLRLQVLHKNVRAKAFYERLGFRQAGSTETHDVMEVG